MGVHAIHRSLVPVQRYCELDWRQARQGHDLAEQLKQLAHLTLHGVIWRHQLMSPFASRAREVRDVLVLGSDALDLLYDFDRAAESQDVASARARDFPPRKAVTPRIVVERSVTDRPGHLNLQHARTHEPCS